MAEVRKPFRKGDVVVLNSGGPKMTVHEDETGTTIRCIWFQGNDQKGGSFDPDTLKLIPDKTHKARPGVFRG